MQESLIFSLFIIDVGVGIKILRKLFKTLNTRETNNDKTTGDDKDNVDDEDDDNVKIIIITTIVTSTTFSKGRITI